MTDTTIPRRFYSINGYSVSFEPHQTDEGTIQEIVISENGQFLNEAETTLALKKMGLSHVPVHQYGLWCEIFFPFAQELSEFKKAGVNHLEAIQNENHLQLILNQLMIVDSKNSSFAIDQDWINSAHSFIGEIHAYAIDQADEMLAEATKQYIDGDTQGKASQYLELAMTHSQGLTPEQKQSALSLQAQIAERDLRMYLSQAKQTPAIGLQTNEELKKILSQIDEMNVTARLSDQQIKSMKAELLNALVSRFSTQLSKNYETYKSDPNPNLLAYVKHLQTALEVLKLAQEK